MSLHRIEVIDSHTGGEPTRTVVSGGPDLGDLPLSEQRLRFQHSCHAFRSAVIDEPRGSDVLVGALLTPPRDPACVAGVIFFNNVGVLNMCGHGTIGVVVTLAHMGRISPGRHQLETPVGIVPFEYHGDHRVTIENVPSYRLRKSVEIDVPGHGTLTGDIAWGGNWFFLVDQKSHGQEIVLERVHELTDLARGIRQSLQAAGLTGADGAEIDHIELCGSVPESVNDGKNFVLCPGHAYDRSPCGTGTSAKLACLAAEGQLQEGEIWRQESIVGSVFEGRYRRQPGGGDRILPFITGTAYVNAEAMLLVDPADPFAYGIRSTPRGG